MFSVVIVGAIVVVVDSVVVVVVAVDVVVDSVVVVVGSEVVEVVVVVTGAIVVRSVVDGLVVETVKSPAASDGMRQFPCPLSSGRKEESRGDVHEKQIFSAPMSTHLSPAPHDSDEEQAVFS